MTFNLPYPKLFLVLIIFSSCITFSCKKTGTIPETETGTMIDIDNNVYRTIKIGDQWWMAENLKVKKYRNGVIIQEFSGTEQDAWKNSIIGAYCQYADNPNAPGLLYNWYAINEQNNLAPDGWHIPNDEEWKELEMHLGMSLNEADKSSWRGTNQGEKIKSSGLDYWASYGGVWGTNESGFSALAGGCRLFDGTWSVPGGISYMGFWWTNSDHPSGEAWYRYLDYKNANVFRSHTLKTYGFSVRCVKNK